MISSQNIVCRSYAHGADVVCWTQKDGVLHFSGKGSIIADPDCSSWEDPCCPPWNRGIHTVIMDEGCTAIAHSTFSNERSLRRVILPSGMEAIGHYAFAGCVNLDTLHIPESVKTIDPHAFEGVPHIIYHGPARSEDNWGALSRN